ncbi:hypothetical protein Rcae01_05264 [Novipirellula caenicola]|uniref:Uncharacterized protein n=1 Tax=Novipirellula caenicola TaxID=1536901 RepID=A0ABP9VXE1_9BACT
MKLPSRVREGRTRERPGRVGCIVFARSTANTSRPHPELAAARSDLPKIEFRGGKKEITLPCSGGADSVAAGEGWLHCVCTLHH